MRKLFTLAAAVLASFSLWAADPVFKDSWSDLTRVGETDYYYTILTSTNYASYISDGWMSYTGASTGSTTLKIDPATDEEISGKSATYGKVKKDGSRFMEFYVTGITSIKFYFANTGSDDRKIQYILNGGTATDLITVTQKTSDAAAIALDNKVNNTIRIFSPDNDVYVCAIKVIAPPACTDPEFTVPEGGTGFVGDPIDLAITSKNNSKPVNYAVTVDGVEGVNGTDYSFNVSPGLVQATPLRAGTFVITFSQASDGTYCAAEESATFEISAKNPVTSFEVVGPAKAHIGEEVTLTATNFDAAPTEISWLQVNIYEIVGDKESYTFTSNAEGTIEFYALARNKFNNPDDQADDYQVAVYHAVTFALGTDATLSDLKVNGATIDGFAADKYEYNVELGVYEALNVEATAADAPYASAAVVDNGEGKVTITVTAQNKSTQDYVINYTRSAATELASISESATWDFTKTGSTEVKFTDETIVKKGVTEFNFADVLTSPDASFNAAALNGIGEYAVREGKYFQGSYLKFQTTVPGKLEVIYCNTGNRDADKGLERILTVNGTKIGEGALRSDTDVTESDIAINAGSVEISSVLKNDESTQYIRVKKVTFTKDEATALDNTEASVKAVKFFQNGQLFIEKNGKVYTIIGSEIR